MITTLLCVILITKIDLAVMITYIGFSLTVTLHLPVKLCYFRYNLAAQQLNQVNEEYAVLKQKDSDNSEIMRKLTTDLDQIPGLTQQIQDLTEMNTKLITEVDKLTAEAESKSALDKENEELKRRDKENAAVVQQLMSDIEGLKKNAPPSREDGSGRSNEQAQEFERLRSELEEEHGQQIVMMKEQLREQMNSLIEDLNKKLEAALKENAQLTEDLKEVNKSNEYGNPDTNLQEQLEQLQSDKTSVQKELEELKKKHEENMVKIQELNAEIETLGNYDAENMAAIQSRMEETLNDRVNAAREHLESKMGELTQRLQLAEQRYQEVEGKNTSLNLMNTQLQQKLEVQDALSQENNTLRDQTSELVGLVDKLKKEMENMQKTSNEADVGAGVQMQKLKADLEEDHGKQITILKEQFVNEIQNLTKELESAIDGKKSVESELQSVLSENKDIKERETTATEQYRIELDKLKLKLTEKEKETCELDGKMKEQVEIIRSREESLQLRLDDKDRVHQEEIDSRTRETDQVLNRKIQEIQSKMEESHSQQVNSVKEEMKKRISELQQKIVNIQEEKNKLIKEFIEKEENFEKQKAEMQQQVQQLREWNSDASEKQKGDDKLKHSVKQLREQILQYRSQIVELGAKLDGAMSERNEIADAFKKAKVAIRDYEKKNPDLAALRKEIEDRDTTIQVMWIENEDLKGEIVRLRGGTPSPSVDRSPGMSPAMSQVSLASSISSRSPHMSPAASHSFLTETITPVRIETYQTSSIGDQQDGQSSLNGVDPGVQELDQLRRKDAENIEIITKLTKELENLRSGSNTGTFVSGEQMLSQSQAHEDSPVVFQLKVQLRDLEKQKEDLIHQKRDLESKLDLEVQTSNEEKKKLTRQVTEWRDWYQTLSVQLADYEQDIKQLKQLKEENSQYMAQVKEISTERDKMADELKEAKRSLADFDQKHPNLAQVRKQMEEMRTTLQVHWIENEQLKKQLEDYQGDRVSPTSEKINELRKKLKEAEEQLKALKEPRAAEANESDESNILQPAVNALASMTQSEMQEHYKSMNTNLALAVAEKQSLVNKIKELEQKLAESSVAESSATNKGKGKDGRKTSREEKANLLMENQALQNKIQSLETQLKEARKVEQEGKTKSATAKVGKRSGVKEDRVTVPERQTFQNRIKELEMQLKEARKATKETPTRPRPTPKKSYKEDSVTREDVRELKAKLQAVSEEKESVKSKLKSLETQLKIEQIEKTALLTRVKEQDTDTEQSDGGAKPSSKQRRKHHRELAAVQRKYDEELKEVRKQLEETRVQYASEVELLQNEHTVTMERFKELEKQQKEVAYSSGSDAESTPRETKEKIHKLKSELQRVKAERDRLVRTSDCSETAEFELHELKMKVDLLESEKVEMSSTIENLEKEKNEAMEAMQHILSEKEELLQKISSMESDDGSAKRDSDEKASLKKAKAGHKAVLQILKAELEQLKADHKIELDNLKTELEHLRASKEKEGAAAASAEEQLEQAKASHQPVIQMLMAELDQLKMDHKSELERVKSDMKRIRKESTELKQLRSDSVVNDEENSSQLRARLQELRIERDNLEDRVRALEVEKDGLETEGLKLVTEMNQEHKVKFT